MLSRMRMSRAVQGAPRGARLVPKQSTGNPAGGEPRWQLKQITAEVAQGKLHVEPVACPRLAQIPPVRLPPPQARDVCLPPKTTVPEGHALEVQRWNKLLYQLSVRDGLACQTKCHQDFL